MTPSVTTATVSIGPYRGDAVPIVTVRESDTILRVRDGETAAERDIRDFVATRLADFKVPRKILFLDEIPKGATGKLQRIGLAEKLGLG